jgi:hypothetical protein
VPGRDCRWFAHETRAPNRHNEEQIRPFRLRPVNNFFIGI